MAKFCTVCSSRLLDTGMFACKSCCDVVSLTSISFRSMQERIYHYKNMKVI